MAVLSSRLPFLATLIVLVISFLADAQYKRKFLSVVALFALTIAIFFYIKYDPRLEYRYILALEKNVNMRLTIWSATLEIFMEHPVIGVGTGESQNVLNAYYPEHVDEPEKYVEMNAHNYPLHILLTFGIVGGLVTLVYWICVLSLAYRSSNRLYLYILILFLLCSLTEVMTATQAGIVFIFAFIALHILYHVGGNDTRQQKTSDING
jgi:O-antigen ligase